MSMSKQLRKRIANGGPWIAALAALAVAATPAVAAVKKKTKTLSGKEAFYRCTDANGQQYYGQSVPPECMNSDIQVVDANGRVVRTIEGQASLEVKMKREAELKAQQEAKVAAEQRDRTLLATYLTVADIERLRDQRLEQLSAQAHVTSQYIVNLQERESRLIMDSRRYRPYAKSPTAPPVPDHVAEEMVNVVNGLQVYREELAKNTVEQTRLRDEFSSDIARFKQLKGIK
jgi:hypothetical protein